jgi:cell division protein FtsL
MKFLLLSVLLAGIFGLLITMEALQRRQTGYRVGAIMEEIAFKEARNRHLQRQLDAFYAPDRLIPLATAKGLKFIDSDNIIIMEADETKN